MSNSNRDSFGKKLVSPAPDFFDTIPSVKNALSPNMPKEETKADDITIPKEEAIIGYKGFKIRKDGTIYCRDQDYKVGTEYVVCQKPKACSVGLHFCRTLNQVFGYYSRTNTDHVFYKVRGWGRVSEENDKLAVDHLELIEKVTDREMFISLLKPSMDEIDLIVADNPNVAISGSLALILLGWLPYRPIGDIDVTVPFFGGFTKSQKIDNFGKSGQETVRMNLNGFHFDCFINPFHTYSTITFEGKEYKVSDPKPIIEAKFRYLLNGSMKHAYDLTLILDKMNQQYCSEGVETVNSKRSLLNHNISPLKDPNNKDKGFFDKPINKPINESFF